MIYILNKREKFNSLIFWLGNSVKRFMKLLLKEIQNYYNELNYLYIYIIN